MVIVQSVKRRIMSTYATYDMYVFNSLNISDIIASSSTSITKNGEKLTPTIQLKIRTTIIYQQYP